MYWPSSFHPFDSIYSKFDSIKWSVVTRGCPSFNVLATAAAAQNTSIYQEHWNETSISTFVDSVYNVQHKHSLNKIYCCCSNTWTSFFIRIDSSTRSLLLMEKELKLNSLTHYQYDTMSNNKPTLLLLTHYHDTFNKFPPTTVWQLSLLKHPIKTLQTFCCICNVLFGPLESKWMVEDLMHVEHCLYMNLSLFEFHIFFVVFILNK